MRLSRAALVPGMILALAATGPIGGTPAAASGPAYTVSSGYAKVVKLGPNADTSCDVSYDLYIPKLARPTQKFPAILTTNGFGGSKADQASQAALWATHQYVVLSYSGLGFGGSSCLVYTDDPDWDGRAASQMIDFLAKQPNVLQDKRGPIVGTWGGSYGGGFQFALASVDTRVRAMVPEITWNDLSYSLLPNNNSANFVYGNTAGVEKLEWASLFYSLGNAEPVLNPGHSGWTNTDGSGTQYNGTPPNPACPGYELIICEGQTVSLAQGYPTQAITDRLRHASAQYELFNKYPAGSLHFPPTLLAQGQADTLFNFADAVANYRGFKAKGAPVKLVLKEGGHSGGAAPGEYNYTDPSKGYITQLELNWFDHYLKKLPVSTGPEVEYFRDWVPYTGSAQAAYGSASAWPAGTIKELYLSGTGGLVGTKTAIQPGSATFMNTLPPGPASYSETSEFQNTAPLSQQAPSDPQGTFAAYTTAPLVNAVNTVGIPTIDVRITDANPASGADPSLNVVLFGKIYDIAPDGTVTLVHRIVSPVRAADLSQPVHINLPGIVHQYAAGHRIQLVLATTDSAYAGSRAVHQLSIYADPLHPAVLRLPVVAR
ncbi:MAG: hypothetical protein QOK05_1549 [Chloroflexota bacterium]|jgi:predicted acyl esterase|nr:hypothetical protein [Chloroflexota bacterium]